MTPPSVAQTTGAKDCHQVALSTALLDVFRCTSNAQFQLVTILVAGAVLTLASRDMKAPNTVYKRLL